LKINNRNGIILSLIIIIVTLFSIMNTAFNTTSYSENSIFNISQNEKNDKSIYEYNYAEINSWKKNFDYVLDVVVEKSIAYVATFETVHIIDVSNANNPTIVGEYSERHLGIQRIQKIDNFVLAACEYAGLKIIDIGNKRSPVLRATILEDESIKDVYSLGSYAFAITKRELYFIDWFNLDDIKILGSKDIEGDAKSIFVEDMKAYIANQDLGLQVVDMTYPENMTILGTFIDSAQGAFDVVVEDNFAYTATFDDGLEIIDIKNPKSMSEVGSYSEAGISAIGITKENNYIFLSTGVNGLFIINVFIKTNPSLVKKYNYNPIADGYLYQTSIERNTVYLADYNNFLQIVDIADINNPTFTNQIGEKYFTLDLVLRNNTAFIVGTNGLEIFNITKLNDLQLLDESLTSGQGYENIILVSEDVAYVNQGNVIHYIDISDLTSLEVFGSSSLPQSAEDFYLFNNTLYIVTVQYLYVWDVSDPYNPSVLGFKLMMNEHLRGIAVKEDIAYLASLERHLVVYNVSDPTIMKYIKSISTGFSGVDEVVIQDETLFVAASRDGFYAFDISNLSNPTFLSKQYTGSFVGMINVFVKNDLAYVCDSERGVEVFNISNLYSMISVAKFDDDVVGVARGVFVDENDNLHIADYDDGYEIAGKDSDSDTIADYLEVNVYKTDPYDEDSDNDTFSDGVEIAYKTDPLDSSSFPVLIPLSNPPERPAWGTKLFNGLVITSAITALSTTYFIGLIIRKRRK